MECPTYKSTVAGDVSYVDVTGVHDAQNGHVTFFAVNRHSSEAIETVIDITGFGAADIVDHQVMTHADLKAANSAASPGNVGPRKGAGASVAGGKLSLSLPAYSYQMIRLKL